MNERKHGMSKKRKERVGEERVEGPSSTYLLSPFLYLPGCPLKGFKKSVPVVWTTRPYLRQL